MALDKVQPGAPLAIPAQTFNTFVDAAKDFRERQHSVRHHEQRESRQADLVLVRNESNADRARFDVLGIDGPIITPTDNANEFQDRVALCGVTPTNDHVGRFVVLLEPVLDGAIGWGCLAGVCAVRV